VSEIKIICDCGFVMERLYWDDFLPTYPEKLSLEERWKRIDEDKIRLKAGEIEISSCPSGGIYNVEVKCPKCGGEIEIAAGYDLAKLLPGHIPYSFNPVPSGGGGVHNKEE
jgi:hypothetical protein